MTDLLHGLIKKNRSRSGALQQDIRHRINAGRVALLSQVDFFERNLGLIASEWKEDDTRVTFADFAISEKILLKTALCGCR